MNASAKLDQNPELRSRAPALEARAELNRAIRDWFREQDFLEVETPIRLPAPALEEHIDCPPCGEHDRLRASPELHMKRLLAALQKPVFQIGPCFRDGERGPSHLPEFQMLEWYRPQADNQEILIDAKSLLRHCAERLGGGGRRFRGQSVDFAGQWQELSVDQAFDRFAETSVDQALAEDRFEQILVEQVLPAAGGRQPLVLHGFPLALGALARRDPATGRAERWELFVAGLELANAYSELTDCQEQIGRFRKAAAVRRSRGSDNYPVDLRYLEQLRRGFPPCAGIALGVDRLLMVLSGRDTIDQVVPFPPESELVAPLEQISKFVGDTK